MTPEWTRKPIKHILLDINGVLFESGEDRPIEGSVEAMRRLVEEGFKFCLVTNECTTAKRSLAKLLNGLGYDCVDPSKIFSPAPCATRFIQQQGLVPRMHVHDGILEDFEAALTGTQGLKPNCLVVGDALGKISRDFIDESLEVMLRCDTTPVILSLGAGRYYRDSGRLRMDTGAYVAAFEYCLGVKATHFGKPTEAFFREALDAIGGSVEDSVMIGDDVVTDVGGAQSLGLRGFLVRTGKYRPSDETGRGVRPDGVFDNLKQAVDLMVENKSE